MGGEGGSSGPRAPVVTCKMATSFRSWLSCLVGKRSLSMTLTATSRPVFRCFPGQGVREAEGEGSRALQSWQEGPRPTHRDTPSTGRRRWKAMEVALRGPLGEA